MDKPARSPLARSFERHMRAENRSDRTIATYLHGLRQAEAFLQTRGTTVEAAIRAGLEAFMADLLAAGRPVRPAGWPRKRRFRPTRACPPTHHPQG